MAPVKALGIVLAVAGGVALAVVVVLGGMASTYGWDRDYGPLFTAVGFVAFCVAAAGAILAGWASER